MSKPVILILGAGSRVGQSVAQIFASKGYKVALTARKVQETDSTPDQLNIAGDLADPSTVADVFSKVRAKLGTPSVVVYNGELICRAALVWRLTFCQAAAGTKLDPEDPLSISLDDYRQTLNVNNISVFVAAQEAARGFAELSSNASKTFIFTGNILNVTTMPFLFNAGVGKAATANLIQCVADVYKDRGFKCALDLVLLD